MPSRRRGDIRLRERQGAVLNEVLSPIVPYGMLSRTIVLERLQVVGVLGFVVFGKLSDNPMIATWDRARQSKAPSARRSSTGIP